VKSQQLLAQGEVLEDEVIPRAKDGKNPAEQVSKARKHPRILTKCALCRQSLKLLILRMYGIMASHTQKLSLSWRQIAIALKSALPVKA
jgi:hypothetical protein